MHMRAGLLRHRIQIKTTADSVDGIGGQGAASYSVIATVDGAIRDLSGDERVQGAALEAGATAEVTIRYSSALAAKNTQLVGNGRTFDLVAPLNPSGRAIESVCLCKETV